jgi:hypothetical protein
MIAAAFEREAEDMFPNPSGPPTWGLVSANHLLARCAFPLDLGYFAVHWQHNCATIRGTRIGMTTPELWLLEGPMIAEDTRSIRREKCLQLEIEIQW